MLYNTGVCGAVCMLLFCTFVVLFFCPFPVFFSFRYQAAEKKNNETVTVSSLVMKWGEGQLTIIIWFLAP